MCSLKKIDTVAKWYKTEGFYEDLVAFGFRTIKPYFYGKTLLEIGPADGAMTKNLIYHFDSITCIEPSKKYAKQLRKKFPKIHVVQSTIEEFQTSKKFDTIILSHVLEHVENPIIVLTCIRSLMHDSSRLIIIVPNANSLHRQIGVAMKLLKKQDQLNDLDKKLGHLRVYDQKLLLKTLSQVSLKVNCIEGNFLKALSNKQMESWNKQTVEAFYAVGKKYPLLCAELVAVCQKD